MPQIYDGAVVILPNPADWRFKLGISNDTGGVSAVSIDGNTAGVLALVSSGTLTLAGGNNITLSQAGNAVTISAANIPGQSVQTQNLFDLTLSGNTAGALALVSSGTLTLAGGNNITLSQAGNAVTISGPNSTPQSVQTQNCVDLSLSGNTSGVLALISSGTAILAGGNNITLSQNGQSITISGPNTSSQSQQTSGLFDLTLSGNTSGTLALVSSGTLTLAGGNNITLSQVGNAVTISAFTQTVQTQNLVDITLSGNTSGTLALISSGTLTLAGGNNITLSQVGNAVTISGPNTSSQSVQTQNCVDLSLSGNTSGTLALISSGTAILAGGNNVTLSQNGQSITISAFNQSVQTQNLVDITLSGNTSGTLALVSSGTLTLAGGNNITLSQVGNAVTISGPNTSAQSVQTQNLIDLSLSGNTSGTLALISSGTAILAGGNNITLSQNGQSITISAANAVGQTVQTQNLIDLSLSGNTTGTLTLISSGTAILAGGNNITLSQNGQSVTISAFNQSVQTQNALNISLSGNTTGTLTLISSGTAILAGGNNITLSQNGQSVTISAFNQSVQTQNALNVTLDGNTTGTLALISSGTLTLAGGDNITLSQNGNAVTISGGLVRSYWHNMDVFNQFNIASHMGQIFVGPLCQNADPFIGNMTVSTAYLACSLSAFSTSALTAAQTFSVSYGLYTLTGATLSLLNSVSTSFGWTAATNATTLYGGFRLLSFHSSQWSTTPVLSFGKYWQAVGWKNQTTLNSAFQVGVFGSFGAALIGGATAVMTLIGTIGAASVADPNATKGFNLFYGAVSTTQFPASLQNSQLTGRSSLANCFFPYVQFNNLITGF